MSDVEPIQFSAEIIKVQTMIDGAIRVTIDLSADMVATAAKLMEAKQHGAILAIAALPVLQRITDGKVRERTERKSKWQTPEESGVD